MPSEYEIRAEALRAAVQQQSSEPGAETLRWAGKYATWLREGAEQDTAPRVQDAIANLTAPVDGVQLPGAGAPSACSCEHPASAHTKWDGCRRIECRCAYAPGEVAVCTRCAHSAGWHTEDGCNGLNCLCSWDAGLSAPEVQP